MSVRAGRRVGGAHARLPRDAEEARADRGGGRRQAHAEACRDRCERQGSRQVKKCFFLILQINQTYFLFVKNG